MSDKSANKDRKYTLNLYKRLLIYVRPYWGYIAISMVLAIPISAVDGASAWMIKPIIDNIFINKDMGLLKLLPVALVILGLVKALCHFFQNYLMRSVGYKVVNDLRQEMFNHIHRLSLSFFHGNPSAMLMSRLTNDVTKLAAISSEVIADVFHQVFSVVALVTVIFYQEWRMALMYFTVMPLILLQVRKLGKRLRRLSRKDQEKLGEINTILQETFVGNKIVKAFCMEDYEKERFAAENDKLYRLRLKTSAADEILTPSIEFLGVIGLSLVIWYGGQQVIGGITTTGTFFSFIAAALMLYNPLRKLGKMSNRFQEAMASTERIFELLDVKPQITDSPQAVELPPFNRDIEYRKVGFSYNDTKPVIRDVNIKIKKGQTVALVGLSGAGKSTLVDLLCRFYDVSEGAILVDGHDLRDITLRTLRGQIGIVTQETILFNDTVAGNIAYGRRDAGREDIIQAAKAAYAHDFIMQMSNGYDTVIGERGTKISGGQRKRLTIARAILKNPAILILDEATSELDSESEKLVQQALENLMQGRTTIAIAHRLSTIHYADQILVLENGRIVEEGNHNSLLAKGGVYHKLYNLQYRGQEQDKLSAVN